MAANPQHRGKVQVIRSSLPYQILLYCNAWYFGFFWIAEILIYIFKGETLPYPNGVLAAEVVLLFFLGGLESLRIFFGQKGNLTERMLTVVLCIVLSLPTLAGILYILLWQTYVLRVEVILSAIELVFIALELLFGIISVVTFAR
ncbi:transmembrane protein 216 isoform X2 [Lingula anatina]|nr:transmembrane protein 216 isoform X2 [Lingula anatina]|eukprot:XP_013400374.1 transmembrane protein 216 isoform X2 [Lingula anatina]